MSVTQALALIDPVNESSCLYFTTSVMTNFANSTEHLCDGRNCLRLLGHPGGVTPRGSPPPTRYEVGVANVFHPLRHLRIGREAVAACVKSIRQSLCCTVFELLGDFVLQSPDPYQTSAPWTSLGTPPPRPLSEPSPLLDTELRPWATDENCQRGGANLFSLYLLLHCPLTLFYSGIFT